jgi:3-dehydroquinate synthase
MNTPDDVRSVRVSLGTRSYVILIGRGLIASAGPRMAALFAGSRAVVVTDANVMRHHGTALTDSLSAAGLLLADPIVVAPGEGSKSFATLETVCRGLLRTGLERRDLVVALGGGVIGDLAAFAASIVRRGVRMVQIPTSLLAQVDSSVGGKTGINTPEGKNLIGTFHQPSLVLADLGALETLPARQMRAGYAEVAKYGLLGDARFFAKLEKQSADILSGADPVARAAAIESCCGMKAGIVARDETETGERALLNLGHTFGHALEAACGFSDKLLHGEAVSIGMVLAFRFSEARGLCAPQTAGRVELHLRNAGLPTRISDVPDLATTATDTLVALMHQDKKVSSGKPTLILARSIGDAVISRDQTWAEISTFLAVNRD